MEEKTTTRWGLLWRRWVRPALFVGIAVSVLRSIGLDWNYVLSTSMSPTVAQGDCILVNKLAYELKVPFMARHLVEWATPQRGEIVILRAPDDGDLLVKRIVGLPGDQIELRNNQLWVNRERATYEPFDDPIGSLVSACEGGEHRLVREKIGARMHSVAFTADQPAKRSYGPVTVPRGRYFVLGDNRDESLDSRSFGFVDRERIIGRAAAVATAIPSGLPHSLAWPRFFRWLS